MNGRWPHHFHINKHSEYGSWQVNVILGWLRCLIPQAGHLMRLKEVKGTCFVKKKLDVVVQMSWISSKLKLGGEFKIM